MHDYLYLYSTTSVYFSVYIIISYVMCHYYDIVSFGLFEQRNIKLSGKKKEQCNLGKSPTLL